MTAPTAAGSPATPSSDTTRPATGLVISTVAPAVPTVQNATVRHFADAPLALMACRSGGVSVPSTTLCQSPGYGVGLHDTFAAGLPTTEALPADAPGTAALGWLRDDLNAPHGDFCFNPIVATENPATSDFGAAARTAVNAALSGLISPRTPFQGRAIRG